jgi:predicted  nucleic acid-binding Zn-ribbon protein
MPPRSSSADNGAYREILARLDGLSDQVDAAAKDAREARDVGLKLTERLETLDLPKQVAELRKDMEAGDQALRSDLVNAVDKTRREMQAADDALSTRVATLETARAHLQGATGLLGWVGRHAPWLIAIAASVLATLGVKGKLP